MNRPCNMNRPSNFSASAMMGFGLAATAMLAMSCGAAQAQTAKDLVSTWELVASVITAADGTKTGLFGPHGTGITIFANNGRVAVININPDVPKFASNNRAQGTAEENKAVVMGSIAYFGGYSIANKVVTMKMDGSTFPNWTGTNQTRTITAFTRNEITWRTFAGSTGTQVDSTYRRIK